MLPHREAQWGRSLVRFLASLGMTETKLVTLWRGFKVPTNYNVPLCRATLINKNDLSFRTPKGVRNLKDFQKVLIFFEKIPIFASLNKNILRNRQLDNLKTY